MDKLVKLASVTEAMRARDILKKRGIDSKIARIPSQNGRGSCGYGLNIKTELSKATEILSESGIKFDGQALGDSV